MSFYTYDVKTQPLVYTLLVAVPSFAMLPTNRSWTRPAALEWSRLLKYSLEILTIALAMDYTSVAVSTRHDPEDLAKILLTGLSSLITFGVLIFAQHPVLRSLGFTVGSGCAIGLIFALFFPLRET